MRNYSIKDNKLKKVLQERAKILVEARKVTKEVTKLQKEQQKLGYKMERLKEKTKPLMEKHEIKLEEFEMVSRVYLDEKTKEPTIEIVDQIEEYKKMIREKKDEDNKSN